MSQKLPKNGFEWMEQLSEFDERLTKNYDENNNKAYILEVDVEYLKKINLYRGLPFLLKERKSENVISLFVTFSHKGFKISIKSWINTKKSIQSNSI